VANDVKIANSITEQSRVYWLVDMVNAPKEDAFLKPSASGVNNIAVLHFRLDDVNLQTLEIGTYTSEFPAHELMFVYNEVVDGVPHVRDLAPEFSGGSVSLSSRAPNAATSAYLRA
jgi:hypothetical protein